MEANFDPLLPAFYLLWNSAMSEQRQNIKPNPEKKKTITKEDLNGNDDKPKMLRTLNDRNSNNGFTKSYGISHSVMDQTLAIFDALFKDQHAEKLSRISDETVVVCTVECDQGNKFVKQVINESKQRSTWARAEDLFVDWLNSEQTSRHAHQVEVTAYFCCTPISTTSDGMCNWLKNMRAQGKIVTLKIKVASLGNIAVRLRDRDCSQNRQRKGSMQEMREISETEDTIKALKKMVHLGVQVDPISIGDWMTLMTLLTDRASLQALDLKRSPTSDLLASLLHDKPASYKDYKDDIFVD